MAFGISAASISAAVAAAAEAAAAAAASAGSAISGAVGGALGGATAAEAGTAAGTIGSEVGAAITPAMASIAPEAAAAGEIGGTAGSLGAGATPGLMASVTPELAMAGEAGAAGGTLGGGTAGIMPAAGMSSINGALPAAPLSMGGAGLAPTAALPTLGQIGTGLSVAGTGAQMLQPKEQPKPNMPVAPGAPRNQIPYQKPILNGMGRFGGMGGR